MIGEIAPVRRIDRWFFLIPLAVYFATCSHHLGLPDAAIIIDQMRGGVVSSHVNSHNLTHLLGWLFNQLPLDNIAFTSNLFSVACGTAAVALFHAALLALGVGRLTAALTAGVLMVSHSMWWHSTQVESYALSAAFLCAGLWLVARDLDEEARGRPPGKYLLLLFFLSGLSVFNHVQNGALVLAALVYTALRLKRFGHTDKPVAARCLAALVAGLLPYAVVLARDLVRSPNAQDTVAWAVGGGFRTMMFRYDFSHALPSLGGWIVQQFPSPFLLLIAVGLFAPLASARLGRFAVFPAVVALVNLAFFMGFTTWDQFAFYLPVFVCLALAGGVGADGLARTTRAARAPLVAGLLAASLLLPPLVYLNIPRWAGQGGWWSHRYGAARELFADRYDMVGLYADPIRHDRGTAERFVRSLLDRLPAGAWLIDDVSAYYQIQFFQDHYGLRPDLRLLLIRPLGMTGWGQDTSEIVSAGLLATNRLFLTATNGPAAEVAAAFRAQSRVPVPFDLPGGRRIYELLDPTRARE
jgi:hypothetical protein